MEIKNYLFKNIYNTHKENIAKKVIKKIKKTYLLKIIYLIKKKNH